MSSIYADAAGRYWDLSWKPLPLPPQSKYPPPDGYTGYNGVDPSWPDVTAWSETLGNGNIALRLPDGVIGLDVDCYNGKTGARTLAHAVKLWGVLPPTWASTSRTDGVSGIRLYSVPPGTKLQTKLGFPELGIGHIEIVQRGHRYAVAPPSIHPDTGQPYKWLDTGTKAWTTAPDVAHLPALPERWLEALTAPEVVLADVNVGAVLRSLPADGGRMDVSVMTRLERAVEDLRAGVVDSRHDRTCEHVLALLRLADCGDVGVPGALKTLGKEYAEAVGTDRSDAEAEYWRMVTNPRGHQLIAATPNRPNITELASLSATVNASDMSQGLAAALASDEGWVDSVDGKILIQAVDGQVQVRAWDGDTGTAAGPEPTAETLDDDDIDAAVTVLRQAGLVDDTGAWSDDNGEHPPRGRNYVDVEVQQTTYSLVSAEARLVEPEVGDFVKVIDDPYESFWSARESLATVRQYALARMCSPWAVLGGVMARTLTTVPHWITLPPLIGGPGSLNLFVAMVARSGGGKGTSDQAAADVLPAEVYSASAGSGEGLAHQYAHTEKGSQVIDRFAVLFSVPEVDTLVALGGRQGATLMSKLREAFSGEELGFGYADSSKAIKLGRHGYRLCLTLGVQGQSKGAAALLSDSGGGTPQRFVWLPATDPRISLDNRPPLPQPLKVFDRRLWHGYATSISIPSSVERYILEAHVKRQRGEGEGLDGHAIFVREKVAFALSVLDGRMYMSETDWELSKTVMEMSDRTRLGVVEEMRKTATEENEEKALIQGEMRVTAEDSAERKRLDRVKASAMKVIERDGTTTISQISRSIWSKHRDYLEPALTELIADKRISVDEAGVVTVPL